MYLTIEETADYLSMPISSIEKLIQQKRIRAVFDGEKHLIYRDQFNQHLEQLELYKQRMKAEREEPIPEDWDAKDED
ncbi:excisionase family DNA-binding protein [Pullulanibacillus sp. KACC 23026]|uniref:excisionase family DNA-binding protein n=1 Tax=Pullulanibacillus sp. KACC 23026 TaxID=3028315 RepID=UPI0023AF2AEE|nr:excisionase family DNA-binding protein [Pullulanibacillus sp. KACC 23026]WEG12317.1 excisionase family DNA-binding protein [Pullulanibacillus sp. KACC 23026]